MMNTPRPQNESGKPEPARRSLLGLLFGFRISDMVRPLFDSTRSFVHLIAGTFAVYKLLPPDYPGLHDFDAPMSLRAIIHTSWNNVRFTREGAVPALLFFTVIGIMIISTILVLSALFSMFIGTAHAQPSCTYTSTGGTFDPACNDAAQMWIDFLFNGAALPTFSATSTAVVPSWGLTDSIQGALGFYSGAVLIVAALILFYHLTAMVLETAHKGVPMGNQARQIWAPIRLVMAIGLLVPIGGGLNSGQYIVIKTAELGSGLATQTWNIFLDNMLKGGPKSTPTPTSPMVMDIAAKMIENYACVIDYNARLDKKVPLSKDKIILDSYYLTTAKDAPGEGGTVGKRFSFSHTGPDGQDACGYLFLPKYNGGNKLTQAAFQAEESAILENTKNFYKVAEQIYYILPPEEATGGTKGLINPKTGTTDVPIDSAYLVAVGQYQKDVVESLKSAFASAEPTDVAIVVDEIKQYGWAFAGAFLSTIERMQGIVSASANAGVPKAKGPTMGSPKGGADYTGNIYKAVHDDLKNFRDNMKMSALPGVTATVTQTELDAAQCASMIGIKSMSTSSSLATSMADSSIDIVLGIVDWVATWNGVWTTGTGDVCGHEMPGWGEKKFKLGVTFSNGADVLQEIVRFGRANLDTGLRLAAWAAMLGVGSGVAGAGALLVVAEVPILAGILGAASAIGMIGMSILMLFAMGFLALGGIFAFLLPLVAFIRFFFGVLVWIGEVIESVIAIPVVALAHLNPEGEGFLSGQAKRAYEFVFSIFLRPVMTVFGLIAGLLLFIVAANFLNFAYGIAVAATGATAYNHEVLTKFVFTLLYVFTMFLCANLCFSLITEFPKSAVLWMAAQSSPVSNIEGGISKMEQYETLAGLAAINKGAETVSQQAAEGGKIAQGVAKPLSEGGGAGGPANSVSPAGSGGGGAGGAPPIR